MTNRKIILTDADGVLLDWDTQFCHWMELNGYGRVGVADESSYDLAERYSLDSKSITRLVEQFNRSAAVGFCKAYADAVPYVKHLAGDGYRFHVITSMGGDKYSRELRKRNLIYLFGDVFNDYTFLDLQGSKKESLMQYEGSGFWWIEDKLENAAVGFEVGLRPILMSAPHNEHYDGEEILIADSWKDVHSIIKNEGDLW